jgi:two-component system LytT family response regulator
VNPLRIAVVDDERLAREGLVELLQRLPDVSVVGAYGDGSTALHALATTAIDVLCVDIRMPGMDGFELVAAVTARDKPPAVIFVTAYDKFAVDAFDVNAVDYLLKPVTADRLGQALDRARSRGRERDDIAVDHLVAAIHQIEAARPRGAGRLIVREVGKILVVATRDLDWIEGADYYVRLHVGAKSYMLRETLASLETRLDPARFCRIHRSTIVNLTRVRAVEADARGDGIAVLGTGARLKVTHARRGELERRLESLPDSA